MKRLLLIAVTLLSMQAAIAQKQIQITVNNHTLNVLLAETRAAEQLYSDLEKGTITVNMSDYGGFEKVGSLPTRLPADDVQLTAQPGDIMLYNSSNIVIFYGSNSWAYTPLGKIENIDSRQLKQIFGSGNVAIELSRKDSGVQTIETGSEELDGLTETAPVYNINGQIVNERPLPKGLYIIGSKKILIH